MEHLKEIKVEEVEFNCSGYLRLILMLFVCFWAFGCPEPSGIVTAISGFAAPCFFILSGYYVLDDTREERLLKTGRKIKRAILCFALMLVFYIAINVGVCLLAHLTVNITKRVIFNFVVLNLWPLPVGDNIWFIQSMLYAYIILFFADKLKLMKFYKIVLVLTFLFMLLTGEFANLIHFNVLGYPYIPGNWLTRALPYILLGKFLREKRESFLMIRKWKFILFFVLGAGLVILEMFILGRTGNLVYQGHMIGFGVMAVCACGFALSIPIENGNRIVHYDPAIAGFTYIFMNPLYYVQVIFLGAQHPDFVAYAGGITALVVSVILALILVGTKFAYLLFTNWDMRMSVMMGEDELE